ncbi:MAG: PP2C family protein-serine/threonine phosphatase [Thermoleophilia bacterium]
MRDLDHITELVDRMSEAPDFIAAATTLADWARGLTGCESSLVRLKQPGADGGVWYPVIASSGSTCEFLRDEIIVDGSECVCGRVAVGTVERDHPFYTAEGSFLWGHLGTIMSDFSREVLGDNRGRCILEGFESLAIIALQGGEGPIGCIHLADSRPELFGPTMEILEAAGRMAGRLLTRHQEQDSERAALETVREALLPRDPPSIPGLDLGVCATTAEILVRMGGDFYDVFSLPDSRVALVAGDYSGKGLDAVGTAARVRYTLATVAATATEPHVFLERANELLSTLLSPQRFASAVCCTLDLEAREVRVALAGHPAPLLARDGRVTELEAPTNLPLGVAADTRYGEKSYPLEEGDLLILYTDGVTECRHDGALFGVEGVARAIGGVTGVDLRDTACTVIAACAAHHDPALPADDRLVLVARPNGHADRG